MTDKQIIIDGVDVAKCRCFTSEWDFNNCGHICKGTECKYKRLWYKKQLKRKEQECKSYKQTLSEIQQDLEFATYCESQECGCDDANECLECTKKQILQKISECEVENDR